MVFVLIEILYFTYVRFFKFSILILSDPYQGYSTRQSVQTLDTPYLSLVAEPPIRSKVVKVRY